MELRGKTINFLGDSITEGCGTTAPERGYVALLEHRLGLAEARNYGIAGTRIARQHAPSEVAQYDRDFCSRVPEMDPDADVVIVFGGTNDYGHGDAPLGTDDDRTPDTFRGACHVLYTSLLERFPKAKIVILTPLHRVGEDEPKDAARTTLKDYVNIIRETAKQYDFPVLDLFENSAVKAHIPEIAEKYTTDGLHPNDAGHEILAEELAAYLRQL